MSTLLEIKTATEALPPEQKVELFHFLVAHLHPMEKPLRKAKLVEGPNCTQLLEAPVGSPPMTTETIKKMLEEFP